MTDVKPLADLVAKLRAEIEREKAQREELATFRVQPPESMSVIRRLDGTWDLAIDFRIRTSRLSRVAAEAFIVSMKEFIDKFTSNLSADAKIVRNF
jgi:hypothetical protein